MSQGKLIVVESGTDASGKATQSQLLYSKLKEENYRVKKIEFPNYKSKASLPVQMYLRGEFGTNPDDVNAFAASTFFAIDRYASFMQEWKEFYESGGIIVSDRYTTSNMVHQGSKIDDKKERIDYLEWLADLEYNKIGLPKPDLVVFLNVDPKVALNLMDKRSRQKDIHETSQNHLLSSYKTACEIALVQKWTWIDCIEFNRMRTIEDINEEIYGHVKKIL
jgi:dTMP kinase